HGFVLFVLLGVGAEQLAERVIDLDALKPEHRHHAEHQQSDCPQQRCPQCEQTDALHAKSNAPAFPGCVFLAQIVRNHTLSNLLSTSSRGAMMESVKGGAFLQSSGPVAPDDCYPQIPLNRARTLTVTFRRMQGEAPVPDTD